MREWDKNIELRSDEVKDIIGKSPSWLVLWGTIIIITVFLLLIIGSAVFQYPDRLNAQITILDSQPPVEIVAKNDGILSKLLVGDGQDVLPGEILGVLESSVSYAFYTGIVQDLKVLRSSLASDSSDVLTHFLTEERYEPGQLKDHYSLLLSAVRNYTAYLQLNKFEEKRRSLEKELINSRIHYDRLFEQKQLRSTELKLAESKLDRQKSLFESGTISELEYETSRLEFLSRKYQFEEARSALSSMQIEIDKLRSEMTDLALQSAEMESDHRILIEERITALDGAISEWELNYLFRTPIEGRVILTGFYSENQRIMAGDRVMTVVSNISGSLQGKLLLPVVGSGKAKVGQKVLVKPDNYPHMEYGLLVGHVSNISLVAEKDFFSVEVEFPNGLTTTYQKVLPLTQGMTGQAEIITDKMSLLVRIISPVRYLVARNRQLD